MEATPRRGVRAERAAQLRRKLLDAATTLFADRYYDDVAVSEIARAAHTAHGSVFHHFGSKRGIYLAVIEDIADRQKRNRRDLLESPGAHGLREQIELQYGGVLDEPQLFLRLAVSGGDPEADEIIEAGRWTAIEALCQHLGLDDHSPAVRIALRGAFGAHDHTVATWIKLGRPFPVVQLFDALIAILGEALTTIAMLDASVDTTEAASVLESALQH